MTQTQPCYSPDTARPGREEVALVPVPPGNASATGEDRRHCDQGFFFDLTRHEHLVRIPYEES